MDPLRIEIKSNLITEQSGTSAKGKPYTLYKQSGYAYTYDQHGKLNPYPERFEMLVPKEGKPYEVGFYILSPASFFVGDFHQLNVGYPILERLPQQQQQKAA